ncbi:Serine/threonine protein kinase [Candidatus Thiomargarita nelsonii]|uniref:Serine/threonine protein kinase n=1 Tax=Candidatus Thiomargarita nelsonii TaxID=1003181 RepID=A0A0A6RKP9_9GAMM|nr:Serine/threonine protein kinase [Candidatus Thiomargarita nelsonii]
MFRYVLLTLLFLMTTITPVCVMAQDVARLLRQCDLHLQANRLTSGSGGTALACYKEVLAVEPNNAKALAGLAEIEARYVKWAKRALDRGQKTKVERYLDSIRLVNADSAALAELEARLYPNRRPQTASPPQDTPSPSREPSSQTATPSQETPSSNEPTPQKEAKIVDVGQIYELINTTECLEWPDEESKQKGGKNGWGSFYPKKDDTGTIVREMKHCHLDDNIYLLQIGQYYVPISSKATTQ